MELLKIKDIMALCGVGKAMATRMAHASGAIIPGRVKNGMILVSRKRFEAYLEGRR